MLFVNYSQLKLFAFAVFFADVEGS